jgi:Zn-dependent protease
MLGWSINLFRIRGIQLSLHFSFVLLLAYAGYEGWLDGGTEGLCWGVVTLLAFFSCVVLHELGHCFTGMRFGVRVRRILLMPIGGMAEFNEIPRQPSQEIRMTLAGPAVNFAIAGLLWCLLPFPRGWDDEALLLPSSVGDLGRLLFVANLVMGVFNLAPVFPMDGGRILRAALATRLPYVRATFWAASVGKVLAVLAAGAALYYHFYLRAALFLFIFAAGELEYRTVRRRELAELQWREALARLHPPPPPPLPSASAEPPLLARAAEMRGAASGPAAPAALLPNQPG